MSLFPLANIFDPWKTWVHDRYARMCLMPSTVLALVLSLFFMMTRSLPWHVSVVARTFGVTAVFTFLIGSLLIAVWGLFAILPFKWSRLQRNIFALLGMVVGVFVGTTIAALLVPDLVGRSFFWERASQVFVFNVFIAVIVLGLMVIYEQMRSRLEKTLARLKETEISEQRMLRLKTQAELASLQARINPHFLFNSLNTIASLVSIDPKRAEKAVEMLSKLMRFSLRSSERRVVLLDEEFEIIRTYLELEKIRLGERLKYDLKVEGDVSMVCVPGMLLQPLVENCIKHGFSRKVCGGLIRVSAIIDAGRCRILVEDNGVGWGEKMNDGGMGLANMRERLNLYFGGRCSLELYNREGAVVDISFPVEGSCSVL